jgi:hypothetical protein
MMAQEFKVGMNSKRKEAQNGFHRTGLLGIVRSTLNSKHLKPTVGISSTPAIGEMDDSRAYTDLSAIRIAEALLKRTQTLQ